METCSGEPDNLLKVFVHNARDIIQCAECRALVEDPVRAGCEHVFCRDCLKAKYVNFDTQETFTTCPICRVILQKNDIVSITHKLAKLSNILKNCVLDFCDDTTLDLGKYLGNWDTIPKTYSKQSHDVPETLQAKEKVEQWLMTSTEPITEEAASTQSFECSSSAQRSLISKESYDILPAASPPPNDEVKPKRGRGKGRGRGQRKSALPLSSGDRSDAKKPPPEASPRPSLSPTFDVLKQKPSASTPLTAPRRSGRSRRPASALSQRSIRNDSVEKEEELQVMEVDLFEPGSPQFKKADEELERKSLQSNESTASATEKSERNEKSQTSESKESQKSSNSSLRFIRIPSAKSFEKPTEESPASLHSPNGQVDQVPHQTNQVLVDDSANSADAVPMEPRNTFVHFVCRGSLFPKKKTFIRVRQLIPFLKRGKFDVYSSSETRDFHECPQEVSTKTYSTTATQTYVEIKHNGAQTDEKPTVSIETQTKTTSCDASIQTLNETSETGVQTEDNKEPENSQESSVDVFHEHNKRPRVLSSSEDEEPKRKRSTFDIEPPRTVVQEAPKTVIMESDEESEGILAPTPPRKVPPKRVFTCSSLQRIQVKLVQDWAKKIGAEVIPTYTPAVTHVIVQVDSDNCAQRTLKFLYGVAAGKWIVSVDWVHSSMREGCIVDEELFESLDMEGEAGPCRSRTRSKTSKLFQAFEFCCQEPFTDVTVDQLRELLEMCGAATAPSLGQIKKNRRHALIVVQTDETNEAEVQRRAASWFDRHQVLSVSREWVLDCLAAYKLISIRPHLIGKHSDSFLRMMRFDEQLLA